MSALGSSRKLAWAARTFLGFAWENELARRVPRLHDWTKRRAGATGRGEGRDGEAGARYFRAVADDYEAVARAAGIDGPLYRGRSVLELGPGDTRAVGLLTLLRGAARWDGVDAFDIESRDEAYKRAIYAPLARGEGRDPASVGELLSSTRMLRDLRGAAREDRRYDLVLSRAVLEHVHDLDALFDDLAPVLAPGAVAIHKVDLRCHGTRFDNELDFLLFPARVYRRMASHLDLPNRVRAGALLGLGERHGLRTAWAATTHVVPESEVRAVRPRLPAPFAAMSDAELRVLGVWLVQVGPEHPLAGTAGTAGVETLGLALELGLSAY